MCKKTKMAQYIKRARRHMAGVILAWTDTDPFSEGGEIRDTDVTHKNPTQRLIARDMWDRCRDWMVTTEFTWLVTMRVIYTGTAKGDKVDTLEFRHTCSLRGNKSDELNDAMQAELKESLKGNDAFPEGHRNKGVYDRCEFVAVVVGV
jgi:hypothetical protein